MIRQSIIEAVLAGLSLHCSFKTTHKQWFGKCELYEYRGRYVVYGDIGNKIFEDADSAIDFFGTLAFNHRNLSHFFSYLGDLEEKGEFSVDDVEYMSDEKLDAMNNKFLSEHFKEYSPHAEEFNNEEAIRLLELTKKEAEALKNEDDE